jgi:D-sedoheptulose 7-phosphate isomerase
MQEVSPEATVAAWPLVQLHVSRLAAYLRMVDAAALERSVQILVAAYRARSCIFVAGNGGSSATASHWVNDLHKLSQGAGRRGIRAMSLSDNVALLTALANDEGYQSVFQRQLVSLVQPGDVLVLISVSGRSANLVEAARFARDCGMPSLGLLGRDGGRLADLVTEAIVVPSPPGEYPVVESAHGVLCDVFAEAILRSDASQWEGGVGRDDR